MYVKVLAIGALLGIIFGLVTFYTIRSTMYRTHYLIHADNVVALAQAIARRAEPLIRANEVETLREHVAEQIRSFPDIRYVTIQGPEEEMLVHDFRFPAEAPEDMFIPELEVCSACHGSPEEVKGEAFDMPYGNGPPRASLRVFKRPPGVILDIGMPLADGELGEIRVGAGDNIIGREVAAVSRALLGNLVLYFFLGMAALFGVTYLISHPLADLLAATNQIRSGDFNARAHVASNDEIGRLAHTFNLMVEELQSYRHKVSEKETARLSLIEKMVRVQEDERKIIARELHDQFGQSLSTVLLLVQRLAKDQGGPLAAHTEIEEHVRNLLDAVKQLAWDIRPSILDDYGLVLALQRYAEQVSRRSELNVDFQAVLPPEAPRLPAHIEVPLYRVAQEAVTNVVRHAEASNASIVLILRAHEIVLIVEDDGKGFDIEAVNERERLPLGLIGMSERIALISGEFNIESEPGAGATVRIRIPLEETAPCPSLSS